ncbi:sulfurtransferase [Halopseudomonas pelagia]|uniref:sulfurtransferase n=1 Tax=Halopseudomonas pelagia TaxID=553151 RepID=UPI0003AAB91E|nr:sulfurtransferase [Halopseudomonas pelagia]|tara:strand:+ start:10969 stop:11808 length:840 start_codon:yes stop_codon:yes gene_type:complete
MSQLIDVHTLAGLLDTPQLCLLDTRFSLDHPQQGRFDFAAGHIPGARYLHLDDDLSARVVPGTTGRHPLPAPGVLQARLQRAGLNNADQVVVYDDGAGLFAARLWWLLRWLGHTQVKVLDGGLQAWIQAGLPISQETPRPIAEGNFSGQPDNSKLIEAAEIMQRLDDPAMQLLDARGPARFRGEVEPLDPVAGHIPGAVNLPCADNVGADGHWLSPQQLAERFAPLSRSEQERVVYCGSGVTACHTILAAIEAGLPEPRLYAGSWSEWITDPQRPVARG